MTEQEKIPRGALFWLLSLAGIGLIAFGLINLLQISRVTHPGNWLRYFIEGLVVHDAILAPATAVGGFVLSRLLSPRLRAPIQVAAMMSGAIALASIPVISGYGRLANNPTILPSRHYGAHLALIVAAIWLPCLIWLAVRAARPARLA